MDQSLQLSQNSASWGRSTSSSSCFICLNDAFSSSDPYCDSDYQPRDFGYLRKRSRKEEEKYNLDCVNILTSYILQNSSSDVDCDGEDVSERRDQLQSNILSSFSCGQLSICSECLSKSKTLMEYQKELERIQKQILDVLGNLQTHLKCSMRRRRREKEVEEGSGTELSRFQEILEQEFVSSSLSVTLEGFSAADYDNQSSMETVQDADDDIEDCLNQNGMDDDDDEDSTEQEAEGNFICHSCCIVMPNYSR